MTQEDLKKLDKKLRQVQDPFGLGFPAVRKIFEEAAERNGGAVEDLVRQYIHWKWRK